MRGKAALPVGILQGQADMLLCLVGHMGGYLLSPALNIAGDLKSKNVLLTKASQPLLCI